MMKTISLRLTRCYKQFKNKATAVKVCIIRVVAHTGSQKVMGTATCTQKDLSVGVVTYKVICYTSLVTFKKCNP